MPTTVQIAQLKRAEQALVQRLARDMGRLGSVIPTASAQAATDALLDVAPELITAYSDANASLAAEWYDEVQPSGRSYRPVLAGPVPDAQMRATIRWAVGPMWQAGDWDAALLRLISGSSRITRDAGRDTIERNALSDPKSGAWVRIARHDACPFCLMLASRGAVYHTKETAGGGEHGFHDNCRCTVSPVFGGGDVPEFNRQLSERWQEVTRGTRGPAEARAAWAASFRAPASL